MQLVEYFLVVMKQILHHIQELLQWDLSLNFLLNNNFTFGVANRLDSAITGLAGIQVSDALMIGLSYDFTTTEIEDYSSGSFEVFIRIDFGTNRKILTPRFF